MVIDGTLSQAQTSTEEARMARKALYDYMTTKVQEQLGKIPEQMMKISKLKHGDDPDFMEFSQDLVKEAQERLAKFDPRSLINDVLDCYDDEELIFLATLQENPIQQRIQKKTNKMMLVIIKNLVKQAMVVFENDLDADKKAEIALAVITFEQVMQD